MFLENDEWKIELLKMQNMKVMKVPKIIQAVMYILEFQREKVCEPDSQLFCWKKAKKLLLETMPTRMYEYIAVGAKPKELKLYQKINYIEKLIVGLEEEQIMAINITFGKLFKWLKLAITVRKQDIIYRAALRKKAVEHREKCIAQKEERAEAKDKAIQEAKDQFNNDHAADYEAYEKYEEEQKKKAEDEYGSEGDDSDKEEVVAPEKPEFESKDCEEKFDEDNPEVEIPEEVPVEVDQDWDIDETEQQQLID